MIDNRTDAEKARMAITTLLKDIADAWEANDAGQLSELFSDDAIFVPFNGARLQGRAAIAEFHRHPFATELQGCHLMIDLVDIRALTNDLYLVSTNGGPQRLGVADAGRETQTYLCKRLRDRWEFVFFQNTPMRRPSR